MEQKRARIILSYKHVNNVLRRHVCINIDINNRSIKVSIKYGCGGRNPKCKHCNVDEGNSSLYVIKNLIGDGNNLLLYFLNAPLTSPLR